MNRPLSNATSGLASAAQKTWTAVAKAWRMMVIDDQARPYRPEQYYMRGPGPKWREKNAQWRDSAVR